jgi:hypothetical protein
VGTSIKAACDDAFAGKRAVLLVPGNLLKRELRSLLHLLEKNLDIAGPAAMTGQYVAELLDIMRAQGQAEIARLFVYLREEVAEFMVNERLLLPVRKHLVPDDPVDDHDE